jgi:hypothetical protein
MTQWRLYTRPDCHLCELADELLRQLAPTLEYDKVNIEGDVALLSQYGLRIPVLQRVDTGAELDWPFDGIALLDFLHGVR